ncbi:MAG: hypothetical protein ACR2NU_14060 [Aeoliella sp.]
MIHCFTLLAATIGVTAAAPPAPQWHSDYGKALTQTRADDRPLLMVIDNPAKDAERLPSELLKSEEAVTALMRYDLCHVDATTKYGKKVAEAFKTEQFPYVAFVDKSGSVILHSHSGELTGDEWNDLLVKYQKGEKPVRRVTAKPVVNSSPAISRDYGQYMQQFSPRPYCAKCQRGY